MPLRNCRPGWRVSWLARRESHEQAAVVVVGGEEVPGDGLDGAGPRAQLELLVEPPHAPLDRDLGRAVALEAGDPERLDHLAADQILFAVAGELEDVAAAGEHAGLVVADQEAGARRRVVVLEQLEEEAEPAAVARDRLLGQALAAVVVDRAVLAVRADEVRHGAIVATGFPV